MPLGCHLVPKVLQSDPKGLQNGALGGHLGDFFCKKPTLHPTAYLLCFRHILEVLASPVLRKFLLEMCVGSRSPKKAITLSLFLIFRRKCVKMVPKWEGAEVPKTALFCLDSWIRSLNSWIRPLWVYLTRISPYLTRISPASHPYPIFSMFFQLWVRYC